MEEIPETMREKCTVQRYIDNPLIVDGFKFDLRVYVVITGVNEGDVRAYLAEEGLARFCTTKYE